MVLLQHCFPFRNTFFSLNRQFSMFFLCIKLWYNDFKLIELSPQLNLVYSYINLVPHTIIYSLIMFSPTLVLLPTTSIFITQKYSVDAPNFFLLIVTPRWETLVTVWFYLRMPYSKYEPSSYQYLLGVPPVPSYLYIGVVLACIAVILLTHRYCTPSVPYLSPYIKDLTLSMSYFGVHPLVTPKINQDFKKWL